MTHSVYVRFDVDGDRVDTIKEATEEVLGRLHRDLTGGYAFEAMRYVREEPSEPRGGGMRVLIEIMGDPSLMTLAGAEKGTWVYTDRRTGLVENANAYKDNPERLKRDWLDMGENHREEEGCSVRELTHEGWFLKVENLNDLAQLLRRSGAHIGVVSSPEDLLKLVD